MTALLPQPGQEDPDLQVAGAGTLPEFVLPTGVSPLALLTSLVAESPYPLQLYSPQGHSLYINPAFRRSFDNVPPADYNVLQDAVLAASGLDREIRRAFAGAAVELPAFWYDPRQNGFVPVSTGNRVFVRLRAFPLRDGSGEIALVVFQFEDLTALQSALEEKDRLLAERDAVLQQSQLGILIADADGRIVLENPASVRILGEIPAQQMAGWVQEHASHPDGSPYEAEEWALTRALQRGQTVEAHEVEIVCQDGSRGTILNSAAPLHDAQGQVSGGVAVFADITRLKELERLREQFMSVAAHELRTPLTALLGHAQILVRSFDPGATPVLPERLRLGAASIVRAAGRLQRLINQLLEISRLDQGRLQLRLAPADLAPLVPKVIEELRFRAPEVTFEVVAPPTLPGVWDASRIEQVLFNLLDNAVRYGPIAGRIRVTLEQRGNEAVVAVEDEGPGLPEEDLDRLFQRYYGAPARGGAANPGFGLGLFLAREIVALHGGSLEAANRPSGGLRIAFTLPLGNDPS